MPTQEYPNLSRSGEAIPYGYCHCGCGEKTSIAESNNAPRNMVKGQPLRFIRYHQSSAPIEFRFWSKVDKRGPDECWEWTGCVQDGGYGVFVMGSKTTKKFNVYAHRYSYEDVVGPIPEGLVLDHLCRNRRCVNPSHLEPVTHAENVRRGNAGKYSRA